MLQRDFKFPIFLFIILCGFTGSAQPPIWSDSRPSMNLSPNAYPEMKADHQGNLIVVSGYGSSPDSSDIQVLKFSPGGTLLWSYIFNGDSNLSDHASSFTIDENNDIYVVGETGIAWENDGVYDYQNTAILSFKVNADGVLEWQQSLGGYGQFPSRGEEVVPTPSGSTYVLATQSQTAVGNDAMLVIKLNQAGQITHTHLVAIAEAANYSGQSLRVINGRFHALSSFVTHEYEQGYVHLTNDTAMGTSSSQWTHKALHRPPMSVASDEQGRIYLGFGGDQRYKLIALDSNGTKIWSDSVPSNLPSNVGGDRISAITTDDQGNIYVTGLYHGGDYGQKSSSVADVLTRKYSVSGTLLWSHTYTLHDSLSEEYGVDIDVNGDVIWVGARLYEDSDVDYLILKYATDGEPIGTIRHDAGVNANDELSSISADDDGIYVTGFSETPSSSMLLTQYYTVVTPTAVEEVESSVLIGDVYPNPFQNMVRVDVRAPIRSDAMVEMLDLSGRSVMSAKIHSNMIQLPTHQLQNGTYLLKVSNGGREQVSKVVLMR